MEINEIGLSSMRNGEHFQFMTGVDDLLVKHTPLALGIEKEYPSFRVALDNENVTLRIELGSSKSSILESIDKKRDDTWRAIDLRIESTLLCPIEDEVTSGRVLLRVLDVYGDIRSLPYEEETGYLTNLVIDFEKPENATHVAKIGITSWVGELKKENVQFQTVFNERNFEIAGRTNGDVGTLRKVIDPLYTQIAKKINALALLNTTSAVTTAFIIELNELIRYYENQVALRRGRMRNKSVKAAAVASAKVA